MKPTPGLMHPKFNTDVTCIINPNINMAAMIDQAINFVLPIIKPSFNNLLCALISLTFLIRVIIFPKTGSIGILTNFLIPLDVIIGDMSLKSIIIISLVNILFVYLGILNTKFIIPFSKISDEATTPSKFFKVYLLLNFKLGSKLEDLTEFNSVYRLSFTYNLIAKKFSAEYFSSSITSQSKNLLSGSFS